MGRPGRGWGAEVAGSSPAQALDQPACHRAAVRSQADAGVGPLAELAAQVHHRLTVGECRPRFDLDETLNDLDIYDKIRYFGSRDKILYVHFRNVSGTVPRFREEFVNTGYVDMHRAMELYYDVGFDGFFIDDHVPRTFRDTAWGHRGRAFANGYIQALIEAVTKQRRAAGRPPGTIRNWTPASPVTA